MKGYVQHFSEAGRARFVLVDQVRVVDQQPARRGPQGNGRDQRLGTICGGPSESNDQRAVAGSSGFQRKPRIQRQAILSASLAKGQPNRSIGTQTAHSDEPVLPMGGQPRDQLVHSPSSPSPLIESSFASRKAPQPQEQAA